MTAIVVGNWWALALRGVAAILFALIAFLWPGLTAAALMVLFGIYVLFDGILAFVAGLRLATRHRRSGALLLEGFLDIVIAIVIFAWPGVAVVALIYLIALWAVITGVLLMAAGLALIRFAGELLLVVCGLLSIILGIILFIHPAVGVAALSWLLGIYALLFGIMLMSAAFRVRYHPV